MDSLGDRMKTYENVMRHHLTRRMPCIIRCDGRAFHSFTKGFERPFDQKLTESMHATALYLCNNIQNAKLAYVQSDEISILLVDYDRFETNAWFDNGLQKMVSVSASMATRAFNDEIHKYYPTKSAEFDSRAFVIPREDVCNYFVWRQMDATRNSVQMLAQSHFPHKELQNLNNMQLQDKLVLEKGINWNNLEGYKKRGACIVKVGSYWAIDEEPPIFSRNRKYINELLIPSES